MNILLQVNNKFYYQILDFFFIIIIVSFVVALLLFNFFCDEVLRSIVHDFHVDLPLNLVDLSRPLCKCK
jgi:hypothetical protein